MNSAQTKAKTVQDIQLDLLELASFNEFDGARVKQDLLANKGLWKGAMMGRFENFQLIPLRDINRNVWNVDTLMILPHQGKETELMELASKWYADELHLLKGADINLMYGGGEDKVLRVWWD
jgi:hypothetical protein